MIFSVGIHVPNLETFKNKSHQVYVLDLQAKKTLHLVGNTDAITLSLISTSIQLVSLNTQNMKVIDIFIGVLYHFDSSISELV